MSESDLDKMADRAAKAAADFFYYWSTAERDLTPRQVEKLRDEWIRPALEEK